MLKGAVAQRYAEALFNIARDQNQITAIEGELKVVLETLEGSRDLQRVLYHPQIPRDAKKAVLREIFGGKVSPVTLNFLNVVLDARREFYLKAIVEEYLRQANETRNIAEVTVTSSMEIPLVQKVNLMNALSKATGKEIRVHYEIDPEILGGLIVRMGDRILDASVKRQLEKIKESIREIQVG